MGKLVRNDHETRILDSETAEVGRLCRGRRRGFQLCGDEPLELADAVHFRSSPHRRLAGIRSLDSEPDTVWWVQRRLGREGALALSHDGAVESDDPRRTREIPGRPAGAVWARGTSADRDGALTGRLRRGSFADACLVTT